MSTAAGIVSMLLLAGVALNHPVYTSAQKPSPNRSFEGTYWRASELGGKPTPSQNNAREAHLIFQPGNCVAGSDGCNRITGTYRLKGDGITFGPMAGTQMAGDDLSGIDRAFRAALASVARWRISGDRLELLDARRVRIAAFDGRAPEPSQAGGLQSTGWQLVKFEACPPNPLNDQIAKQWTNLRSYTLKGGHLFLALMADGGIYECEPVTTSPKPK